MANLARYDKDGIELIIDTQTGESFASQSGYARMAGVSKQAISNRYNGTDNEAKRKTAEIQTPQGMRTVNLVTEDLIAEWLPKDNPAMATQLIKLGVRVFMHKLAGYEVSSTAVAHKIPQTYAEALLEAGRLALENEALAAKIEQDAPLVAFAETVQASEDSIELNEFAKAINTGRTRLFRLMREIGVIMKNTTLPYQRWCDAGYFEVSQEVTGDGKLRPFALVTGKGQIWLKQKIDNHLNQQKRFAQLLVQGTLGI